ncbi:MAG: DUF2723 domain-containing protein [Candidatus Latescibacteria bacterium]|nr:DUF2723 domain-containing protein [Candidatus Latescibacterota bacterium]
MRIGLLTFVCALILYVWTAAPTIAWGGGDSAKLALWVHRGEIGYAAESHPLYVTLGRLFASLPLGGDLAYRLNLFSAVCAALAVCAMCVLCGELTGSAFAAACAAAAFALSHTFWLHAVLTEVYALHLLLLLSALACLLRWDRTGKNRDLYLSAGLLGAGVANHILTVWALPGVVYLIWSRGRVAPHPPPFQGAKPLSPPPSPTRGGREGAGGGRGGVRLLGGVVAAGCLGASPLLYAMAKGASQFGLFSVFRTATGLGSAGHITFHLERLPLYGAYLFYQFPALGFALGWVGLYRLFRRDRRIALALALIGVPYLLFPVVWDFRDHYQFALSFYACFAVGIAPGICALSHRLSGRRVEALALGLLIGLPLITYASAPALCRLLHVDPVRARTLPHRDNARYFLWPSKRGDDGARRYGTGALRAVAPDAVIVGDYTPALVLTYLREVEGLRPDVTIRYTADVQEQLRLIAEQIDHRPVYAATLEDRAGLSARLYLRRDTLPPDYEVIPEPPVYRVVKKN